MRIAMVGTRGVPAAYGGFETAIEEIGKRLVQRGHQVTVYTRPEHRPSAPRTHLGMELVPLPAVRSKSLETMTHTGASVADLVARRHPDVTILFNAANAMYLPALRARHLPVATHVDGLEWRRAKWGGIGRRFYRVSESLAVRYSDALIADADGIAQYYSDEFGATTDVICYGAPILESADESLLGEGLRPGGFHLLVSRFEPENHVLEAVSGYAASAARLPYVVVGGAPFAADYTAAVERAAGKDPRVLLLGPVWDQHQLDALYFHALTYTHGHSVGGTNPSLLRAMGAGTATLAYDVLFNREVLGPDGRFFADQSDLTSLIEGAEDDPAATAAIGSRLRQRARTTYDWDEVAANYEALAARLASGRSQAHQFSGKRRRSPEWQPAKSAQH